MANYCISIHALLAESDTTDMAKRLIEFRFLSTLSLRRATVSMRIDTDNNLDFYPRSPCGERLFVNCFQIDYLFISIHALLAESDCLWVWTGGLSYISIHALLAESDCRPCTRHFDGFISIHALLAESDCRPLRNGHHPPDFYPRSPCGERQCCFLIMRIRVVFLSTLSLRRAT